jgi:transposase-like protein
LARGLAGSAATLDDLNGMMRSLMKTAIETMLHSEMSVHLGRGRAAVDGQAGPGEKVVIEADSDEAETSSVVSPTKSRNRRNGSSPKTIQGESGQLPIAVPRDREGTFEPLLLGKYQRRLPGFDEKIFALYAKGMTTRDIQDLVKEL